MGIVGSCKSEEPEWVLYMSKGTNQRLPSPFLPRGLAVAVAFSTYLSPPVHAQCPPSFAGAVEYLAPPKPDLRATCMAIGDASGDGRPDVVLGRLGESSQEICVFLGNADGTFAPVITQTSSYPPNDIALGDMNGDGKLDLVAANILGVASVSLSNGDGTFAEPVSFSAGINFRVAIGDVNNDGKLDVAVARLGDIAVFLGNGDGTVGALIAVPSGVRGIAGIAIGDINGDNKPDLARAGESSDNQYESRGVASVMLGNGDGTFGEPHLYWAGSSTEITSLPRSVAIRDLNGDGTPDLLTANSWSSDVALLLGRGDGTFGDTRNIGFDSTEFSDGFRPQSADAADLNGDGMPEVIVANQVGYLTVFSIREALGSPLFFPAPDGFTQGNTLGIADLNGDGRPDIVRSTDEGIAVLINDTSSVGIVQQPAGMTIMQGQDATLQVVANGAASYRWRRDGIPLSDGGRFSGTTTATLVITGALVEDAGVYDVEITATCRATLNSRPVALGVLILADSDADGTPDRFDLCPADPHKTNPGACGCGVADADANSDGVPDCLLVDLCPADPNKTQPGACGCGTPDTDSDNDTVPDCFDRLPGQNDLADSDGDGVITLLDNCPTVVNPDQADANNDGLGDACTPPAAPSPLPGVEQISDEELQRLIIANLLRRALCGIGLGGSLLGSIAGLAGWRFMRRRGGLTQSTK